MLKREEGLPPQITEGGHEFLSNFVTDTKGKVYALKENTPSAVAAAAMARLSRCANDLRVILVDEFLESLPIPQPSKAKDGKEIALLKRVVTAYGDDSVAQLVGLHVVVMGASNILTKLLERGRIGTAFLEQSTRYIYFDEKILEEGDVQSHYRYRIPPELSEEHRIAYVKTMDRIFESYSQVVHGLVEYLTANSSEPLEKRDLAWRSAIRAQACDSARSMLPAAATSNVGIYASAQALDSLIMHLRGHELQEARETGDALLRELRKVAPVFFERTDMDDRGGATTAYLRETRESFRETVSKLYPQFEQSESVELVDYYPKNEEDAISQLPYSAEGMCTSPLTQEDKNTVVKSYVGNRLNRRHKPGRMFENPKYTFRYRTPYSIFRDLQRHRVVSDFEWHRLKPSKDYDIPDLIKKAEFETLFVQSFNESQVLYESLNRDYDSTVAQYAVLFGHKINWGWSVNLRELIHIVELRTTPQGHPDYRRVCQKMYDLVHAVHPTLAGTIDFINCGESPELARLASERATAFKLSKLQ